MKKILIVAAVAVFGLSNLNAQGFKVGVNVGYPIGDFGDFYSVQVGADVAYTWEMGDSFHVGVATGYGTFIGGDMEVAGTSVEIESFAYIPVAATATYGVGESWFLGADVGYAVYAGSAEGGKGGMLYQPKFGYQSEGMEVFAFYKGISLEGGSLSSVGAGVAFKF